MKRFLLVFQTLILALSVFAQFNGDGYYRIKNVGSGRYITVRDNRGSINPNTTSADMGAVKLYKGFENIVSDPSSVLYIDQTSSGYRFHSQGTDTYEIIGYYLKLKQNSDGSYKAYQGNSMMVMYLGDGETSSVLDSKLSTQASGKYRDWYIIPISASSKDNYFGLKPEVLTNDGYYASFYASFPFTVTSNELKVCYVTKLDNGMAVYKEVAGGTVPGASSVFIKCISESPVDNKLDIISNSVASISNNKLSGVYFDNPVKAHWNRTVYNPETMRVLGTTSDGKLAYVKANYEYLPANRSYLNVPAGSPEVIELVTEDEYQKYIEANKTYTITFKIDGVVVESQTLKAGESIVVPDAPSKEGYTFSGWGNVPAAMPAHDLTFEGSYSVNYYTITFKIDNEIISTRSLSYGSTIEFPEVSAKEGYTFSGWGNVPATMPAQDLTFEGSYSVNYYAVTFKIDNEIISSQSLSYGSTIEVPEVSAKEGYTFSGWGNVPATMPAQDLTFEGSYSVNYYAVTFKIDNEIISSQSLSYGSTIEVPEVSAKEGYTFCGWGNVPATMPAQDLTFEGNYSVNYYTITFRIDKEIISTDTLSYGSTIEVPEVSVKEGYTFSGWGNVPSTMPAKNLTFEGVYSVNYYAVTFKIDNAIISSQSLSYGSTIDVPEVSAKEGYTFSGWGDVPTAMPANNLTFEGSYSVNYYTLTLMVDNEVIYTDSLSYGSSINLPEAPSKEGYTFSGWGDVPTIMPAKNLTFEGLYSVNYYTVTFKVENEVVFKDSLSYGSPIVLPEVAVKEGFRFSGWGNVPSTMPAKDLVFQGKYVAENYYTVYFRIGDELISMQVLTEGALVEIPDAPEKEGYTFNGWGDVPATMPAQNLSFEGSYSVNYYSVTFKIDNEVVFSDTLSYGSTIDVPEVSFKEGYTFSGWDNVPATMPAQDLVFDGTYILATYYTVTFKIDNEVVSTDTLSYGSTIDVPEVSSKEGYTFSGWGNVPSTMPAQDLVFEGTYTVNYYTVTFILDDEVIVTQSLPYGSSIVIPEIPVKEGYTFNDWGGNVASSVPAYNLAYYGKYLINSYDLIYMVDNKEYMRISLDYDSPIDLIAEPIKEGRAFSGWSEAPERMPASDWVVSGVFAYKVMYYVQGVLVHTDEVPFGDSIPTYVYEPTDPTATFLGWIGETYSSMPDHDVTYSANILDNVNVVEINSKVVDVYTLSGVKVMTNVSYDEAKSILNRGIYIINGRKVVIE